MKSHMEGFPFFVQGSPDLKAAREVANYLGTLHKEFHFTVQVWSLPWHLQPHATLGIRLASIFHVCKYIFLVDFLNE